MSYNGWKNYETWCVALWLDNDECLQNYWRSEAQEVWEQSEASKDWTREEEAKHALADRLRAWIDHEAPALEGFWADLLNAALSEVRHEEIAASWLEEVDKDNDNE